MEEKCLFCERFGWIQRNPECFKTKRFVTVNDSCDDFERMKIVLMGAKQKPRGWTPEKRARKMIGLPLTKQLVYYPDRHKDKKVNVICALEVERHDETALWYTLDILLDTKEIVRINSLYFAEMQEANFVKAMSEQDREADVSFDSI